MKTMVIDEVQIKQAALAVATLLIVFFVLGCFIGSTSVGEPHALNQDNADVSVEDKKAEASAKTELSKVNNNKKKSQKLVDNKSKNKDTNKKKISKKQAEKKKAGQKKADQKKINKKKTEKKKPVIKKITKKTVEKSKAPVKTKPLEKSSKGDKKTVIKSPEQPSLEKMPPIEKEATSLDERIYSIQAGMFASKDNAKSFIEKLASKEFNGYVSDFVSSSGAVKYNVRIGNFEKRDEARLLLKKFKKTFSSPAYVVIAQ